MAPHQGVAGAGPDGAPGRPGPAPWEGRRRFFLAVALLATLVVTGVLFRDGRWLECLVAPRPPSTSRCACSPGWAGRRTPDVTVREPLRPVLYDEQADAVRLLDQRLLPHEERWLSVPSAEGVAEAIRTLAVRGAPAIGVAAAYALACEARRGASPEQLSSAAETAGARPAHGGQPGLGGARMAGHFAEGPAALLREAHAIRDEDEAACRRIGALGAALVADGACILTHCNAGALATAGYGTALGVVRAAFEAGKGDHRPRRRDPPLPAGGAAHRLGAAPRRHPGHAPHRRHGRLAHAAGRDRLRGGGRRSDRRQRRRRQQDRHLRAGRAGAPPRAALLRGGALEHGRPRHAQRAKHIPIEERASDEVVTMDGQPHRAGGRAGALPGLRRHAGRPRDRHHHRAGRGARAATRRRSRRSAAEPS